MKRLIQGIIESFGSSKRGFSGLKLSALFFSLIIGMLCVFYGLNGLERGNFKQFTIVLGILCGTVLTLLGIFDADDIIRIWIGKKGNNEGLSGKEIESDNERDKEHSE